jgi:MscS family membrane protein
MFRADSIELPAFLYEPGPLGLSSWQWLALPGLLVVAWLVGSLLSRLAHRALLRATATTSFSWDDAVASRLRGPLALWCSLGIAWLALSWLQLHDRAELLIARALHAFFLVGLFWALARLTDVGAAILSSSSWTRSHGSFVSLVPLGARLVKIAVLVVGVLTMLAQLGYSVAPLVAGLGIGGLAIALAAQKTMENLFGAFSIGADQPFREGDFVRIEDFVGTVEHIGLRSTKFRTLDRTLITIPNGRLADMRLESFAVRDRIRLACTVGLVYETSAEQMRQVLAGLESVLREHPKIWADAVVVRFMAFGASSLDIEVMAWFQTSDWGEFQAIREDILLAFLGVVERAGTAFAFPTRTLHLASPSDS